MSTSVVLTSRLARMDRILRESFRIIYLELENESAKHAGHYDGDGESHWRALVVAQEFAGMARLQRHRSVNQILTPEFEKGLHALVLALYSPEEWDRQKQKYFLESSSASE